MVKIKDKYFVPMPLKMYHGDIKRHSRFFGTSYILTLLNELMPKDILFVVTLNGAKRFADEFLASVPSEEFDVLELRYKSYIGTESGACSRLTDISKGKVEGRKVVILEDIVDSGQTAKMMIQDLMDLGAESVEMVPLCIRKSTISRAKELHINPYWIDHEFTLTIPDGCFIVGFGLDYMEEGRDLDIICTEICPVDPSKIMNIVNNAPL